MNIKSININQDILKIVALITMTIDHAFKVFSNHSGIIFTIGSEVIGRIAMPIFSFLLMYHLYHRQIFKKYLLRLAFFGILTTALVFPFQSLFKISLAFPFNILMTFFLAIYAIWIIENIIKSSAQKILKIFLFSFIVLLVGIFATFFQYGPVGFCYLLTLYFYFKRPTRQGKFLLLTLAFFLNAPHPLSCFMSFITTLFLLNVDMTQEHRRLIKHWETFYIYYPLHLLLLCSLGYLWVLN